MANLMNHPILVFVLTFLAMWVAARVGNGFRKKHAEIPDEEREDLGLILTATLTLLGLIIGFTFSMAVTRYDQRKNYEEEEANAIGTEYVRVDLLPGGDAEKVRELLRSYVELRVRFYETRNPGNLRQINAETAQVQGELWNAVKTPAETNQNAVVALVVKGMNDVINTQGYTQAAWWNRIRWQRGG